MHALHVLPLALMLAGCGDSTGTEISLNGAIKLPRIQLDAGDFDINGVHLPPGSKVIALNITGNPGDERMRMSFTSPIAPGAVREWFQGKLAKEGLMLTASGDNLSGKTDEGKPFSLTTKVTGAGSKSIING